mgnify:CR=1 FL=1
MQEKQRQVYDLLEITNRQFNECNALYHAVAQRYGLSDAAFWVLYALRTTHEPQTQNRMAAEWGQPKQTLNSAVAAMVKKGLVELCPGNGAHSGKIVTLTDEGRALATRTVGPVIAAEQQAMTRQGLAEVEQNCRLTQRYLECLRQEFEKNCAVGAGHTRPAACVLTAKTGAFMLKSNQIQLSDHFTTGRLLKFTASPIIMMIFTSIYTIVDGFFVSNYAGKTAFTALNLIYPYLQMLGCLGFMIGTGGSALVAMTLGTGDENRANRLFSMLVVATAVLGVLFSAFGLALLEPVALRLGATPELLPSCLTYGRILLTFQTAFMLQYLFQSFFIAAEKPRLGLCFTVAAGATNMVLDFVLVGVAGLGLAGAAAATVISQMVGGVAPIFYFAKRRPGCRLYFTKPLFSLRELFKACTNGVSELMTNISMSLVSALYNIQLLKLFGADGVAVYGVLMYVGFVFAAVFIGYSQGTAPIVSYHFGADNKDELKNLLRRSVTIIAVAGVAMLAASELLAGPLAKIFVGYDAGLLALTTHGMKLYSISFILSGFNIFGSAFFTALNNGAVSAAISFLRTLLFQIVSILTLPLLIGVDGIWLAVVAAEAMALVCTAGFIVWGRRKYGYM